MRKCILDSHGILPPLKLQISLYEDKQFLSIFHNGGRRLKGSEAIETFKKKVENEDFSKKKVLNFFCFELFSKIYSGTHSVEK